MEQKYGMSNYHLIAGIIAIVGAFAAGWYISCLYAPKTPITHSMIQLRQAMRELWAQHVIWTREFIVSQAAHADDLKAVTQRLLKNQDDIGSAVVPFYGKAAGDALAKLLREHIVIGAEVVKAAQEGDKTKLADQDKKWHQNAQDLATFLHKANEKNWPYQALVDMLNEHLKVTTEEAVAHLKKQADADIAAFDKVFPQAMMMADALSDGIIKQFPEKFKA